jgi:hypothetical protein
MDDPISRSNPQNGTTKRRLEQFPAAPELVTQK